MVANSIKSETYYHWLRLHSTQEVLIYIAILCLHAECTANIWVHYASASVFTSVVWIRTLPGALNKLKVI